MENILLLQDEENADLLDKVLTIYLEHSGELVQDLFRAAEQKSLVISNGWLTA